jgi:DNA gyrase subunit A
VSLKGQDALTSVLTAASAQSLLLVTKRGMCIRFPLDQVPQMGRVSAGVKGVKLDEGDELLYAALIKNQDEVLLISDRGYGKSVPGAMFDVQGRAGKGVHCFFFNKNGSTGTCLAGALLLTAPRDVDISQHGGAVSVISSQAFPVQALSDKGKPIVVAILDDVVTGIS